MDYGAYPGSNAISIVPEASGPPDDFWVQGDNEQAVWATEDDYGDTVSNATYDSWQSHSRAGSEQPPSKKSRNSQGDSQGTRNGNSKTVGKMFFKTKLCSKFRAGTCPYVTNCNFAHGIEELRKPPPNWQDIVASQDEGYVSEPREEHQIPTLSSTIVVGESERSFKARRCKKFYTEEGCPYGDSCTFVHDEQSKARESVAINLSATGGSVGYSSGPNSSSQKPSNWKTRMCNKWEMTGYCPFGSKCHFAHGAAELHRHDGGSNDTEGRDAPSTASESKQVGSVYKAPADNIVSSSTTVPHSEMYHIGVPSQRTTVAIQRQAQRAAEKWKGPDKISKIYGDWIDDFE